MKNKTINEYLKSKQIYLIPFILALMNLINVTDRYVVSSVLIDVQNFFQVSKSTAGLILYLFIHII